MTSQLAPSRAHDRRSGPLAAALELAAHVGAAFVLAAGILFAASLLGLRLRKETAD
jgi:hypothetical protein